MFTKNALLVAALSSVLYFLPGQALLAGEANVANGRIVEVQARKLDPEAKILADYLASYGSPLQYHAQDFADAAKQHGVDWKLVPAIAGVESTFGKFIPGGHDPRFTSYNAWGWGVYGNQAIYFSSWREAIFTITRGLKENYINRGLTNPYAMNRIYAASPVWGSKVSYFLGDIESFAKDYPTQEQPTFSNELIKTAGSSARVSPQLTLNI